jgi:hypothetical protein
MEEKSVDKLSAEYIDIRSRRERLKGLYEAEDEELAGQMALVESQLLDVLNSTDADSISTSTATVIRRVSKRYSTTNWDAVYKLVAKHDAFGVLEKRIHNTNMKQFLEEHPDEYPAGLNVDSRYAVTVRRKTSTPE